MAFSSEDTRIYEWLNSTIDASLDSVQNQIIESVQGELGAIIYLLMMITVIIMGYRMVLGKFSSSQEFYSVVLRILAVGIAVTAFTEYNSYVTDTVEVIKSLFVKIIPLGGEDETAFQMLDRMLRKTSVMIETIRLQTAAEEKGMLSGFTKFFTLGMVMSFGLWLETVVMTAIAFLFLLFSNTLLTFFIGVGPLFFCFLLFEPTKQLFTSWFQAIMATLIFILVVSFVVYLFVEVNETLLSGLLKEKIIVTESWGREIKKTTYEIQWRQLLSSIIWCIVCFFIFLVSLPITQQLAAGAGVPTGSIGRAITAPLSLAASGVKAGAKKAHFHARYAKDNANSNTSRPMMRTNRGDYVQRTGTIEGIAKVGKRAQNLVQRITGKDSKNANSAKNSNRKSDSPKSSDNNVAAPQTKAGVATVASSENTAANSAGNQNDQKSDSPKSSDNNVASPQTKAGVAAVASSENTADKSNNNRPNQSSHQLNSQNNARSSNNDLQPKTTVLNSPKDKQINRNISETEQQQRSDDLASIQKSERGSNYSQTSERKNSEIDSQNSNKPQIDKVVTNQKSSDARLNKIENQISQSKSKTTQQTVDKSPIEVTKKQQESAIETTKNPRIPRKK